tara:strand:+ start:37 stop:447 length:411 start_codon:yes stop_codon:yes gene_type:complete
MRGLYLMRYYTGINIKFYDLGLVGYKFGRTSNIDKRLEYYKNNKSIKYNLIKFFPCNNEKLREEMLKSEINFTKSFYSNSEHIEKLSSVKEMIKLISKYANGKLIKDYKKYHNHYIKENDFNTFNFSTYSAQNGKR